MKDDANIKVPRASWELAHAHVKDAGGKLRVFTGEALEEKVAREEQKKK